MSTIIRCRRPNRTSPKSPRQELVEEGLTPGGASVDLESAPGAAFDGVH